MKRLDNFSRFNDLRSAFPLFCYEAFEYNYTGSSLDISFLFTLDKRLQFRPKIVIPWKENIFMPYEKLSSRALDNLIFNIGMIELISYWKAACPPNVVIKPYGLSADQVAFWKKLYFLGLGEFFYANSIDTTGQQFMQITPAEKQPPSMFGLPDKEGALVPVGGGKDSAVSMGLLNKWKTDWTPMVINPRPATEQVILAAGKSAQNTAWIRREIEPQLLELNAHGYLNGHTPFSALLAFYSLLIAYLTGRSDIILSNESSANEPTIPGTEINHQYSKSFGFERDFRIYCRSFISEDLNYFSLLRPLPEILIAKLFSGMPQYFDAFRSCNAGSKTNSWCGACPKCLFTFIILSPFMEPQQLEHIFGKNLFREIKLKEILDELTGQAEIKPFECIGTTGEVNLALRLARARYPGEHLPELLQYYFRHSNADHASGPMIDSIGYDIDTRHFVPENYYELLSGEIA